MCLSNNELFHGVTIIFWLSDIHSLYMLLVTSITDHGKENCCGLSNNSEAQLLTVPATS